jgi:L-ascorbate metabolism protein UlaG (beta-lactamase superfamily)
MSLFVMEFLLILPVLAAACSPNRPLRLTYIANEGVMVATGSHRILIDALFDAPNPVYAAPPPELLEKMTSGDAPFEDIDLCLVTHNHPDHFRASVVEHFLLGNPRAVMIAPLDVVEVMRDSAEHWPEFRDRVVPIDLLVGERSTQLHAGMRVHAFRTLHSGARASPMNVMYLVEMDDWNVFHEGDSNSDPDSFLGVAEEGRMIDLALVHYWFPFEDAGRQMLGILMPRHIGLIHLPIEQEQIPAEYFDSLDDSFTRLMEPGQELELTYEEDE